MASLIENIIPANANKKIGKIIKDLKVMASYDPNRQLTKQEEKIIYQKVDNALGIRYKNVQ